MTTSIGAGDQLRSRRPRQTATGAAPADRTLGPLLSSKFVLPAPPAALVPRAGLQEQLGKTSGPRVISIVAPPGYGKTTLLGQWAANLPGTAYINLDKHDNDPVMLISGIARALDLVEPLDPDLWRLIASPGRPVESALLPALVEAIWARRQPTTLMLDEVHRLTEQAALDVIAFILLRLPPTLRVALVARREVALPLARLRVAGQLLELGPRNLALNAVEARAMAANMGGTISSDIVATILARTEGWPAATYLALRSRASPDAQDRPDGDLRGTEATIADYMRSELLDPLDAETRAWLRRSSVLDTLSGPLCDAAMGTTGSLALLRKLERDNVFLVAIDAHRSAYRYHRLFRDLLLDELEERESGAVAEISARAAVWCSQHDEPEHAVDYAYASGDMDLVARLVLGYTFPLHWKGRIATVARWLEWFDRDEERDRRAPLAMLAGWTEAMEGRTRQGRRWLASAERSPDVGPMPDGADKAAWLALLRGFMAPSGEETLAADARTAIAGVPEVSPFRQTALILAGFAEIVAGSLDAADAYLADAVELAEARRAVPGLSLALGERAVIAIVKGDMTSAGRYVEHGLAAVRDAGMEEFVGSMTLHAAAARVALANGSPSDARLAIAHVNRLRPRANASIPVPALQMRFETIRACITLREVTAARTLMLEVKSILRDCPDLGTLVTEAAELDRTLASMRASTAGPWTLTTAELRLLAYLPTHLTFPEIAERLFVSSHTVKSQAVAIYGKLGVSSRRGAIEQAVEAGLLDESVIRMPGIA